MKVLHLISGGDSGGAKTHLFALTDKLKEMAQVRVACLMRGVFYEEILKRDIDTCLFEQKNRFDLSVVNDIADMINKEKFDVCHVHGARANFVAVFLNAKINIPIVTTIHSDYLLDFDTFFKKIIFTSLNRFALHRIPYYIAVSDAFRAMLIERGFNPNDIYTVYNGMDFSLVPTPTPKAEFAAHYNIDYSEKNIYVGIAARFDAVKGVDVFLRGAAVAAKKNPDLRFLIAGDGALSEQLHALCESEGIADKTQFLGFVGDIYGFLNFIDINTLTSHCESFPYSMLEGAAMSTPIIASDVGGISALVKNASTGLLFADNDYAALGEAIASLAASKADRESMGRALHTLAQSEFSSERFAAHHIEIYKAIIAAHRDKKRCDVVLSGYYGFHNSGDDALLSVILRDLKEERPNLRAVVLSNRPKETRRQYGVDAVRRTSLFGVIGAFKRSKMLISGGGSLLQDETSSKSLWYYAGIIALAKAMGLKVMQYANGIGPITKPHNIKLCKALLERCVDKITLRDLKSAQLLEQMGIKGATVTADPAINLDAQVQKGDYICVSLRPWKGVNASFDADVAAALDNVCAQEKLSCVFVPMQSECDVEAARRVARKMHRESVVIEKALSVEETVRYVRGARALLSMRLHPLIYALGAYVGSVGIVYDPKVQAFIEYSRSGVALDISKISELSDALLSVIKSGGSKERAEELCALAKQNAIVAAELLGGI